MTAGRSSRFSPTTMEMLLDAGWRPGRDVLNTVKLPNTFQIFPAAARVLTEFGNLRIGQGGPGRQTAQLIVDLNPMLAVGEADEFGLVAAMIGSTLYPLGETDNGMAFLSIDEQGRVFMLAHIPFYVGTPFDVALERLLTGRRVMPVDEQGHW